MSVIWVIGQGKYSDFSVRAAFTDKEQADRIVDQINEKLEYDKAFVFAMPLDIEPEVWTEYRAQIKEGGIVERWDRQCVNWHTPDYPNEQPDEIEQEVFHGQHWTTVTALTEERLNLLIQEQVKRLKK